MNICLYGASSNELDKLYIDDVFSLGQRLAVRGHRLIYGGGARGLMGAAARGVYTNHGEIIGIVPGFLNVDGALFENCTELIYTNTMRDRKQKMEELADSFVMVPGGIGTFEEFFEILTLKQLGKHNKPIAVLNTNGYFDSMANMIEIAMKYKFVKESCRELYSFFTGSYELLCYLEDYEGAVYKHKYYKDI